MMQRENEDTEASQITRITEKENLTEKEKGNLDFIELNMGPGKGTFFIDVEHSNLSFYIKSAIQIAHFYGNMNEEKRLMAELDKLKNIL